MLASRHSENNFCYICPDGHIYALASAKLASELDVLLSAFAIFVLTDIYTLGLGIIKASFVSALDFCYICAAGRQQMMKCIKTDS